MKHCARKWEERKKEKRKKGVQVRLVCFDFDCTLSVVHMFKHLAGWEKPNQLEPPSAPLEPGRCLEASFHWVPLDRETQ